MDGNEAKRWDLDTALYNAVVLAWNDLVKSDKARAVRVEYIHEPEKPIQRVRVWVEKEGGYEDLICECWAHASPDHPGGTRFESGWGSAILAQALDFILAHQSLFVDKFDFGPHGLVRVQQPDAGDRMEALEWFKSTEALENEQLTKTADGTQPKGQ